MTIAQASKETGLTADTLRYYERIGLISAVSRKSSGVRDYSAQNLKRIQFLKCMRSAGMPLETLIEYVNLFEQGDHTADARKGLLVEQLAVLDSKLELLTQTRDRLQRKIENYDKVLRNREKELLRPARDPDTDL